MCEIVLFAPRAARMSRGDEGWADAIGAVVTGKGLTSPQVLGFCRHVDAWRAKHPSCAPENAPLDALLATFVNGDDAA